jgi:hypothetical protein
MLFSITAITASYSSTKLMFKATKLYKAVLPNLKKGSGVLKASKAQENLHFRFI